MTDPNPEPFHPLPSHVAVIGAGPAGLMAAEVLAGGGARVTLYDGMPAPGRKFLLAGRGGLNLTHSEELAHFLARYRGGGPQLEKALRDFPPLALIAWCETLGETAFVGTSGRVFPKSFKASPLLRAWLRRLGTLGVSFAPRHRWQGFDEDGALRFATPAGEIAVKADATVLALGGASWPRLGSDAAWTQILAAAGIALCPLRPANCGFIVAWTQMFRDRFAGTPLKGAAYSFGEECLRGEATITQAGIEGGAIYALSAALRDAIDAQGKARLSIALRPDLSTQAIEAKLRQASEGRKPSLSTLLRKALKLAPVAIGLLYESSLAKGENPAALPADQLARRINAISLDLTGTAPLARAISTAGGIAFAELDEHFMLRKRPGIFAAGEMLDWEAPTGGYLLQASFATGAAAGRGALRWLGSSFP